MDNVARLLGQSTEFKLNGRMVTVSAAAGARLSHSLRNNWGPRMSKLAVTQVIVAPAQSWSMVIRFVPA